MPPKSGYSTDDPGAATATSHGAPLLEVFTFLHPCPHRPVAVRPARLPSLTPLSVSARYPKNGSSRGNGFEAVYRFLYWVSARTLGRVQSSSDSCPVTARWAAGVSNVGPGFRLPVAVVCGPLVPRGLQWASSATGRLKLDSSSSFRSLECSRRLPRPWRSFSSPTERWNHVATPSQPPRPAQRGYPPGPSRRKTTN